MVVISLSLGRKRRSSYEPRMNRSQASKIRADSKEAKVASKAAADNRSRASRANSQDKAASRSLGKAVNRLNAEFR
jgi:hypothetical protein